MGAALAAAPAFGQAAPDIRWPHLNALGYEVTEGAAPGYVEDRACGICHQDLYRSYQNVGMARSFYRPRMDNLIEDFENSHYFHEPSGRHYEMKRSGERLTFRRYQLDADGAPIHEIEIEVDWILGSGHTSRTYLYRTPSGELFQLPIAWYSQGGRWAMAPGYDRPNHNGVNRRVRRECMFCHNAYPDVPAGSDAGYWNLQTFPEKLPEGTGCQRCHGPGAWHSELALQGEHGTSENAIRNSIVQPGKLPPDRLRSVCYQCHLQPSVVLSGTRRYDRADYSFRPGEPLADYKVSLDIVERDQAPEDRFEINHHPYRLEQSRCFKESLDDSSLGAETGQMTCLTCHDPHRKVPKAERIEHYRNACLSCHTLDACQLDAMDAAARSGFPTANPDDCVSCHMPRRRTQDVVHVVMTDHKIQRRPPQDDWLAPRQEREPQLSEMIYLDEDEASQNSLASLYQLSALIRTGGGVQPQPVDLMAQILEQTRPENPLPYYDLAFGLLQQRRLGDLQTILLEILEAVPKDPQAIEWMGLSQSMQGQRETAIHLLKRAHAYRPDRAETLFNLGRLQLVEDPDAALQSLREAVRLRPNIHRGLAMIGRAHLRRSEPDLAVHSFQRALTIDPTDTETYIDLAGALWQLGKQDEARRYLEHGERWADEPRRITQSWQELEKEGADRGR